MFDGARLTLFTPFPRKRESRASAVPYPWAPAFAGEAVREANPTVKT